MTNITCVDETTRVLCSGSVDTQSFTIDAYVTYPAADTTAPQVTLVGSSNIDIEYGSSFVDPGATWIDNRDGSDSVVAFSGTVDISRLGTYTLEYKKSDIAGNTSSILSRTVNVKDTTAPLVTFIGNNNETIEFDTGYSDSGATWSDDYSGSGVIYANSYIISALGAKNIDYTYVDDSGNTGSVSRTLNVVDTISPTLSLTTTNSTVDANIYPITGTINGYATVTISG